MDIFIVWYFVKYKDNSFYIYLLHVSRKAAGQWLMILCEMKPDYSHMYLYVVIIINLSPSRYRWQCTYGPAKHEINASIKLHNPTVFTLWCQELGCRTSELPWSGRLWNKGARYPVYSPMENSELTSWALCVFTQMFTWLYTNFYIFLINNHQ